MVASYRDSVIHAPLQQNSWVVSPFSFLWLFITTGSFYTHTLAKKIYKCLREEKTKINRRFYVEMAKNFNAIALGGGNTNSKEAARGVILAK